MSLRKLSLRKLSLRKFCRLSRCVFTWMVIGTMSINTATAFHLWSGYGMASCAPCYDLAPCAAPCDWVWGSVRVPDSCCVVSSGCVVSESVVTAVGCSDVSDLCCGDLQVESCLPQGGACDVSGVSECCSGEYAVVSECGGGVISGCTSPGCAVAGCTGQDCIGPMEGTIVSEGIPMEASPMVVPDESIVPDTFVPAESVLETPSHVPEVAPEPDSVDDLFDDSEPLQPLEPATTPAPLDSPTDLPAEPEPLDNLFDDPAARPAAATPEVAPATDDLFGDPLPTAPEPAAPVDPEPVAPAPEPSSPPAEADDFGDLFGLDAPIPAEATPATAEEPVVAEEPAVTEEPADDGMLDDLFGDPPAELPADPAAPAVEAPADDSGSDDFGDLFGQQHPTPQAARQALADGKVPMRTWSDNTGQFQIAASLVEIGADYVRLTNGDDGIATVPLRRLSAADCAYVQGWASLLGRDALRIAER